MLFPFLKDCTRSSNAKTKEDGGKPYLSAFLFLNSEIYDKNRTLVNFIASLKEA
jgi:hypothetical protein